MGLGLKGSTSDIQFFDRMKHLKDLETYEFHLEVSDFTEEGLKNLESKVQYLYNEGVNIVMHQPMFLNGIPLNMRKSEQESEIIGETVDYTMREMVRLCEIYDARIVAHWHYYEIVGILDRKGAEEFLASYDHRSEIKEIIREGQDFVQKYGQKYIYLENALYLKSSYDYLGIFAEELAKDDIINLTYDVSHAFISLNGDNDLLVESLEKVNHKVKHFHIVDSNGVEHDASVVGEGKIDWKRIKPLIEKEKRTFVHEIGLVDVNDCKDMVSSNKEYNKV